MVAVSAVLSVLAIISVILRFLTRKHKGVEHNVDDYLIMLAMVRRALL